MDELHLRMMRRCKGMGGNGGDGGQLAVVRYPT